MPDLGDYTEYDSAEDAEEASADDTADAAAAAGDETDAFEEVDASVAGEDRGVGTVAVSEGLCIGEEADETTLRAYVTAANRPNVRIGKYLLVPYPDEGGGRGTAGEKLFCRITALEYVQEYRSDDATEIHARRAMRSDGIDEADYKFLATLEPVAILYEDGDELKRRMTDRVPKPETPVREATDASEIKTGLKMPDDGVFLGHLSVGGEKVRTAAEPPTIDYRLKDDYEDGDPLVFRHTLVAGGTGSGKTHASKNALRQFLSEERTYEMDDGRQARAAVVQFDPQDEYAQMHDDNPAIEDADRRRFEREGIAHGGHDDTKALVPVVDGTSYGADHHRAEQVEFTIPFSMVKANRWLIAGGQLNDNQFNALDVLVDRFFRQYGDGGTYEQFRSFLDDPALREELHESGSVHEATFDAVKRRVRGFGDVFDGDARPITEQISELVRPGGLTVVPTYHVNDTRATEVIVLAVSSLLIDQKLSNAPTYDRIKETPLVVGMDEAHNFLTDAESVQARKVIGKFTEAAKQGRKERLGLFLITQDPQDIADSVFKQINTTVVLNLGDEDAISSVNIPSNLEGKVPYMEKGQMVVYSPDNSEPVELIGLPKCLTKHGRE
ncbi:ATP-binding protein [Halostella sp. PRR32]|uniref:ATP-binding protein n=1 Tax=Halostella sp. PRR32 TaxID=3098147 RepID=UPI002B1CE48A|nr:ATP-binding protein [Halostella sp. PRR32]